ncbi:MAG TPA: peptidoglycan DD-metalloendopeptidase family protein [Desulfotomaculum sp.]|nr:peptidoglycan DD-metalloendopeptidase family protein [Desulfotomaculum sp.]
MNGDNELDMLLGILKQGAKNAGRKLGKAILKLLAPYLPVIAFICILFMMMAWLVAAVYSAFPGDKSKNIPAILAGVKESEKDKQMLEKYMSLCEKWNRKDTWLVNPGNPSRPDGPNYESSPENPFHPNRGKGELVGEMIDRYNHDLDLKITWGQAHAAALFRAYALRRPDISDSEMEKVVKDLHPYFYYKASEVITCGKDGCERHTVYLLVEAYTIRGHFQYHYRWRTDTYDDGSVTYEEFAGMQQILPNMWQRLEDWIKNEYGVGEKDITLARTAVWEASMGFDQGKEWLQWLLSNYSIGSFTSFAMVPPEFVPFLKEAEEKFGIPAWFLAALFQSESDWNYMAVNTRTGCFGISQQHPDYWRERWIKLGFVPPEQYQWDPRAQILAGALVMAEYLGDPRQIDWNGDIENDIKVIKAIAHYKGWSNWPNLTLENLEGEEKRQIEIVLGYARGIQVGTAWPVPGHKEISSHFGWRIHPVTGKKSFHEGIDIPAPTGTPVVSVSGGIVTLAGWNGVYGNCVIVRDAQHEYLYGHLSEIEAVNGQAVHQTVQPGQEIGKVGSTGLSTGPHLHFGVKDLTRDCWIDPELIVQPR